MEYPAPGLLNFLGIHTSMKARVYTEKIQLTREISHGIPRKSVSYSPKKAVATH